MISCEREISNPEHVSKMPFEFGWSGLENSHHLLSRVTKIDYLIINNPEWLNRARIVYYGIMNPNQLEQNDKYPDQMDSKPDKLEKNFDPEKLSVVKGLILLTQERTKLAEGNERGISYTANFNRLANLYINLSILSPRSVKQYSDLDSEASARNDLWALAMFARDNMPQRQYPGNKLDDETSIAQSTAALRSGFPQWMLKEAVNAEENKEKEVNCILRALEQDLVDKSKTWPAYNRADLLTRFLDNHLYNLDRNGKSGAIESYPWQDYVDLAKNLVIGFPSRIDDISIHNKTHEYFDHLLSQAQKGILIPGDDAANLEAWGHIKAATRVIWPENFVLTQDEHKKILELQHHKNEMTFQVNMQSSKDEIMKEIQLASDLKILNAELVKLTTNGLMIENPGNQLNAIDTLVPEKVFV